MPLEYQNKLMTVLCNDCLKKSNVPYHIVGGKCLECNSYNTTRTVDALFDAVVVSEPEEEVPELLPEGQPE